MLQRFPVQATIPCSDLARAKSFYAEKLRLTPSSEDAEGASYDSGGTPFLLFLSSGVASGTHTQMGWRVDDIEAEVRELRERGVQFETYDVPGFDAGTGIAQSGEGRSAWFKDSEGNLLALAQFPDP